MQREIVFDKMEEFISGLAAAGIKKIAFAAMNENRPEKTAPCQISVVHVKKLELLAYKNSVIYKYVIVDPDFGEIFKILESRGFEVKKSSRNIT